MGPVRGARLEKLGVRTIGDLLFFFPRRYEDRRKLTALKDLCPDSIAGSVATVVSVENLISGRKKMPLTRAMLSDGLSLASALWFNRKGLDRLLSSGTSVALFGRVSVDRNLLQFVAPEFEILENGQVPRIVGTIVPVYPLTAGLTDQWLRSVVARLLEGDLDLFDPLPLDFKKDLELAALEDSVREMHRPSSPDAWRTARRRLAFDELFAHQVGLALRRRRFSQRRGAPFLPPNGVLRRRIEDELPFDLTEDQRSVLSEIAEDLSSDVPMNRLLQGDVGSGKTVVALLSMLQAVDAGYQAAFMAPTSILAQQHGLRLETMLAPMGVSVVTLTGGSGPRREDLLEAIARGDAHIVVGTHALIQEDVRFARLGLAVIDEQHRFGVLQRGSLGKKGLDPHVLVMTATPIPRTLAMSVYGDLAVSVIRSMPLGRMPVKTRWIASHRQDDLYGFMAREMDKGHRIFWVCPIIEESEHLDVRPLDERYQSLTSRFGDRVGMLHGRMTSNDRFQAMEAFASGKRPLLASTTVIEVGVDVPEATVMVIENAERFGLSQLHQLRGRVGRGDVQSWCFLLGSPGTSRGSKRLDALCSSSDGFAIAEADLAIRGPGEICGVRQHGVTDFQVADLVRDVELLVLARKRAFQLIQEDPNLKAMPALGELVYRRYGEKLNLAATP